MNLIVEDRLETVLPVSSGPIALSRLWLHTHPCAVTTDGNTRHPVTGLNSLIEDPDLASRSTGVIPSAVTI